MGKMFHDEVLFSCPKCNSSLYHKTKAGDCILRTIPCNEVPVEIAESIRNERIFCKICDRSFIILYESNLPITLKMRLV